LCDLQSKTTKSQNVTRPLEVACGHVERSHEWKEVVIVNPFRGLGIQRFKSSSCVGSLDTQRPGMIFGVGTWLPLVAMWR
jgi:hypothetical protein